MRQLFYITLLIVPLNLWATTNDVFPLSTNGLDWNIVRTNKDPILYLWDMAVERYQVAPSWIGDGLSLKTYIANNLHICESYSDEEKTLTFGDVTVTITNKVPQYITISITNDLWANTNFFTNCLVTYTNENGVETKGRATVPLFAEGYLTAPYSAIFYAIGSEGGAGTPCVEFFADTNKMSNGNYNAWFSTINADGSTNNTFPMLTASNVFTRQLGTNHFEDPLIRFSRDFQLRAALLAESAHTNGGWDFRHFGDLPLPLYAPHSTRATVTNTSKPVLMYYTTNASINAAFTLYGTYCVTQWMGTITNYAQIVITNATETVSVTSSNTTLLHYWFSITNITGSTLADDVSDSVTVQYTNGWKFYHTLWVSDDSVVGYSAGAGAELDVNDLNERWKVLNPMTQVPGAVAPGPWFDDNLSAYSVHYEWSGGPTNTSWADAQNLCQASTNPVVTTNGTDWSTYTKGVSNYLGFTAYAGATELFPIDQVPEGPETGHGYSTNVPSHMTNYAHAIDFYIKVAPVGNFDAQGDSIATLNTNYYQWTPALTVSNIYQIPYTSSVSYGSTNMPPNWNATADGSNYGWKLLTPLAINRFDVTNGFRRR